MFFVGNVHRAVDPPERGVQIFSGADPGPWQARCQVCAWWTRGDDESDVQTWAEQHVLLLGGREDHEEFGRASLR